MHQATHPAVTPAAQGVARPALRRHIRAMPKVLNIRGRDDWTLVELRPARARVTVRVDGRWDVPGVGICDHLGQDAPSSVRLQSNAPAGCLLYRNSVGYIAQLQEGGSIEVNNGQLSFRSNANDNNSESDETLELKLTISTHGKLDDPRSAGKRLRRSRRSTPANVYYESDEGRLYKRSLAGLTLMEKDGATYRETDEHWPVPEEWEADE